MDTRKLWRKEDFIIVNAGSPKEAALLAEGWGLAPKGVGGVWTPTVKRVLER